MIIEKVEEVSLVVEPNKTSYVFTAANETATDRFESLFLANSFDLIDLLVQFGIAHLFP